MSTTSAILNRSLRRVVCPILHDAGFDKVDARNAWRWRDQVICIFNIRAVGNYFSEVTGWPPGSICVWQAVFYRFMPQAIAIAHDTNGRLRPAEHQGHMRTHLDHGLDQSERTSQLPKSAERCRKDVRWVERDGSNAEDVADDVAMLLRERGLAWFDRLSNIEAALAEVEASHDCYVKFDKAAHLARALGDRERWRKYAFLAETEATRIDRPVDRVSLYGL